MSSGKLTDPTICRLFHRTVGKSEFGPRIGGRAPLNILPSECCSEPMYLATLPFDYEKMCELSIYWSNLMFSDFSNIPVNELVFGSSIISAVLHNESTRSPKTEFDSKLSEHPIFISKKTIDQMLDYQNHYVPFSIHKLGGKPYLVNSNSHLADQIRLIFDDGFMHILQFDFIVKEDAEWDGDWPFGDGLFNLFGREPFSTNDWCWVRQC